MNCKNNGVSYLCTVLLFNYLPTVFQAVLLESVEDPANRILIANTHLYSNKDTPEVRLIQAALCVYYCEHLLKEEVRKRKTILCKTSHNLVFI